MEFRILGPLEVEADGVPLTLGPTKQRALLALLLLSPNRVVSREHAINALWGEHPPGAAATALHGYVSGLRKALGKERIETRAPGYVLRVNAGEVDLDRFESLRAEARTLEPSSAAERLRPALALWRGLPFGDLDSASFLEAERRRLEELRLSAVEELVDANLALGRHAESVAELDLLVRDHPLRERLRAQLMLALYRSGRQAEALESYRQGRNQLAEELGLEPGETLRRLERGILEQDSALGPVVPPVVSRRAAGRRSRHRVPRRARFVAGVLALGIAGAAAGTTLQLTGGSGGLVARANSVAVIDPATNRFVADVAIGKRPSAIAVGEGGVWVANTEDGTISRIDPRTKKLAEVIGVGSDVHDLAVGFGSVWAADGVDGTVTRIDARTGERLTLRPGSQAVNAPQQPVFWVATGLGSVWATSGNRLVRIDPNTNRVVAKLFIPAPAGLAVGLGYIWLATQDQQLLKLSPRGESVGQLDFKGDTLAPTVGEGAVWLIVYLGRGLIEPINPASVSLGPGTETNGYPLDVTTGPHSVWAVDVHGTVLRIDPTTANVVARIQTAPTARSAIAVGAGAVWVAIQEPT